MSIQSIRDYRKPTAQKRYDYLCSLSTGTIHVAKSMHSRRIPASVPPLAQWTENELWRLLDLFHHATGRAGGDTVPGLIALVRRDVESYRRDGLSAMEAPYRRVVKRVLRWFDEGDIEELTAYAGRLLCQTNRRTHA